MKWCVNCFRQYEEQYSLCPFCGEEEVVNPKEPVHLRPGSELYNGRYVIGLSVGSGGFGVVYRAWDKNLKTIVAIKEFYMSQIMVRAEGDAKIAVYKSKIDQYNYNKRRFLAEARAMAKFGGSANIPKVYDFFEANNTAYISMELFTGTSLREYLNRQPGKKVDPEFAVYMATEVAKSLKVMHQNNVIHRDIAPDNIFYTESNKGQPEINVIDLGTARLADDTDAQLQIETKPGYTPVEQYDHAQKDIGPWTDIYALGATLYNMLTGIRPEESTNRKNAVERKEPDPVIPPNEIDFSIPVDLSNAVMRAMAIDKNLRLNNVDDFVKAINGKKKVRNPIVEKKVRRRKQFVGIAAALIIVGIIGSIVGRYFIEERKEAYLNPARISMWISVNKGSSEEAATRAIVDDFMEKYPNVQIDIRAIDSSQYAEEINEAAKNNQLPNLFESTGVSDEILSNAHSVDSILTSEQAADCLFLNQYHQYYLTNKKIPLGMEVPMAYLITSGALNVDYADKVFMGIKDFGEGAVLSVDEKELPIIIKNFGTHPYASDSLFFDNEANQSAVLLSSSMELNRVRESLTQYSKAYVFYDNDYIYCRFTYEWSIGEGSKDQLAAAERLLSWMLGNVYQNMAMVSLCNEGQIPINTECFKAKIDNQYLSPIKDIYSKFVFEG